jgi:hypothetical protein
MPLDLSATKAVTGEHAALTYVSDDGPAARERGLVT